MPKPLAPLSATSLRARIKVAQQEADATGKRKAITDGQGLTLECRRNGNPMWLLLYTPPKGGVRKTFTMGPYPALTLETAREVARALRIKIVNGIDPNDEKSAAQERRVKVVAAAEQGLSSVDELEMDGPTVREIAVEYLAFKIKERPPNPEEPERVYVRDIRRAFDADLLPKLGHRKAAAITEDDIHAILKPIAARNALVQLRRFHMWVREMFRNAKSKYGFKSSPVPADTKDYPNAPPTENHPHFTDPKDFARLLRAIDAHKAFVPRNALLIHARTGVRPYELMEAEWTRVGVDYWTVLVKLGNKKFEHLVPLTPQTQACFEALRGINDRWVCPGRHPTRHMSEATLNAALASLGFKGQVVTHGFRHTMSTLLNEMGWTTEWVEKQLSHIAPGSKGVYNKAQYLLGRMHMMACWSDYVDALIDPTSDAADMLPLRWHRRWLKDNPLDEDALLEEMEAKVRAVEAAQTETVVSP